MEAVINIALPFFGLIFTGYAAGRYRVFGPGGIVGLNAFAFFFALPALLVVKLAQAPTASLDALSLVWAYYSAGLALYALTFVIGRVAFGGSMAVGALQGLSATFSNVGFVGLPLVILAFGADAALPAVIIVIVDTVVMMGIATALIEVDLGGHGAARNIVLGLVRNPIIIASLVGLGLNLGSVEIPGPLMSYGDLLANAAGPCALFALGATLAGRPLREGAGETAFLTVMKLGVHPLLVAITALYVFDLSPLWASVAIVQASLPIAANVYVLAQRYEVHAGQVSTAILISTAVSVFTVSIVLAQLYGGG